MLSFRVLAIATCCLSASLLHAADERPGRTFKTSSVTIYYETLGSAEGTPLVVANGGPGFDHTYLHLSDVWDVLAKTRKLVLYDRRGVGRSSPIAPGQSCTLRDQIEDLEASRAKMPRSLQVRLGTSPPE
jgi:pimeloyl-ACP methyl ester carboxylesterase